MPEKISISTLVAIFILSTIINLNAQNKPPSIEVFGTATIKIVPDKMNWNVQVQVDMDDVKEAKYQNDISVSRVLNILDEEGILSKDIQTGGVRISKRYRPYGDEKKYTVTNDIWFTVYDIGKYDNLTEELIEIENVYIKQTNLASTKAIETREQARTDALNAAKDKAEKMAETLGMTVVEPLLIQEQPWSSYTPNFSNVLSLSTTNIGNVNSESIFSEGTISISTRVMVTFKLVNKY